MAYKTKSILILVVISFIFLMLGNNFLSLTNPDEVFYSLTTKEMVKQNTWMTPYIFGQPQFEKPILLYWLLRSAALICGFTNFSMRFFPALFGMLGVLAVYFLGLCGFKNERKAFICGLILSSAGLYVGMCRTVFTDLIFSVLILMALASFYWGYTVEKRKSLGVILFFVFCALSTLAKGPLGALICFLTVFIFLFARKETKFLSGASFIFGILIFLAIALPWYVLMEAKYGAVFNKEFFYNDHFRRIIEAEHSSNDTWYFYPLSMFGCMFPWSLYLLPGALYFLKNIKGLRKSANPVYLFILVWIAVVFFIFQPAHSKLVSYILPLFPALAMIGADYLYSVSLDEGKNRVLFIINLAMLAIILIFAAGILAASKMFSSYVTDFTPVYIFSALFFVLAGIFAYLVFRQKTSKLVFALSAIVPLLVFALFSLHKDVGPYVSSEEARSYLKKNFSVKGPVITVKFFARGVRYFTEEEVMILSTPPSNFFSPHPVKFLGSADSIKAVLANNPDTFFILNKRYVDYLKEEFGKDYDFPVFKQFGSAYVIRIKSKA